MYVCGVPRCFESIRPGKSKKRIKKLLNNGFPQWIIKVISQWCCNQTLCVKWGSVISDVFPVNNGVRQGGILSPLLSNVYINDLSISLSKLPIWCFIGENVINHLMYADDIVLLSPSAKVMQRLLDNAYTISVNDF